MPLPNSVAMDEKSLIAQYFAPLIGLSGVARGLKDDVAVWRPRPDHDLVINTDTIVAGVHFFDTDPLDLVARKLLRCNISDLIAKGAKPIGYQLSCAWSPSITEAQIKSFVAGLRQDQDIYGIELWGGDTVLSPGPLVLTATMMGVVPNSTALSRSGAKPGDHIFVGGVIGQSLLGLRLIKGEEFCLNDDQASDLISHYHLPRIKTHQAEIVSSFANAAMDISDGLLIDAQSMALASKIMIELDLELMPTSAAARQALGHGITLLDLAQGGDDYQILCSADPVYTHEFLAAGFSVIGRCQSPLESQMPQLIVRSGRQTLDIKLGGYQHNWG